MRVTIEGSNKGRIAIVRKGEQEITSAIEHELNKTIRRLKRIVKGDFEIRLTVSSKAIRKENKKTEANEQKKN